MGVGVGCTYWSGSGRAASAQLYVALTNRCNARTLPETRGPGFSMGSFSPLSPHDWEPSEDEVVSAVSSALGLPTPRAPLEPDSLAPICFAGLGEPLLRAAVLVGATARLRERAPALAVRVSTNGLFAEPRPIVSSLAAAGVSSVSVALAAADSVSHTALMAPNELCDHRLLAQPGAAHAAVCDFVRRAAEAGLHVECTAVAAPGVDVDAARSLALELGAKSWRVREYFPAAGRAPADGPQRVR
ncbi:hypothetical protein KFE25_006884 [Diacronema lutheri]|uniref:Radical SAM core domain-containing protein n=1 Tax=Diacronema lutheri TaxID=2081491 RepID=A0A8J5XSS7_DIALT|nr:hypothetical protein KFE25_006884 [Diacronema lutheri]